MDNFNYRGYQVIDLNTGNKNMQGVCAQFMYRSRVISFSTLYLNDCSVAVFDKEGDKIEEMFLSVEDAIQYVDKQAGLVLKEI